MSDSQHTRFVKLRADTVRGEARNDGTHCSRTRDFPRVGLLNHQALFNTHQRRLHQVTREYPRPGVAVFALHSFRGIAGHLWLEATSELRAGTIGRHSSVDLFLPDDDDLSLRHLLVMVTERLGELRVRVADLATPAGFQAEEGGVLRAVDANGVLVLAAASYALLAIPTGHGPVWNAAAEDPWKTLPRRVLSVQVRSPPVRPPWQARRGGETAVSVRRGPIEPGPAPLLTVDERAVGELVLKHEGREERLHVGAEALERGVILGRYARCAGSVSSLPGSVSRVHALLIAISGEVHLIDAGSTNGIFIGDQKVKCAPAERGVDYLLGDLTAQWQPFP